MTLRISLSQGRLIDSTFCRHRTSNFHKSCHRFSGQLKQFYASRFLSSLASSSVALKPWKDAVVESHGDYRAESFLEAHIGGQLYENQRELPRLPIPSVEDTIGRFLPSALPLAKTEEEKVALKEACEVFPEQAKVLQERLMARRDGEMKDSSWLQLWWNQLGYLQVRDPVVVNVSYFFQFVDDPTIDADTSMANVQRAAALLFATADFRKLVCSGELPPEKVGKKGIQLCSAAYKYMFNACRIPLKEQDSYRIYDPSRYTHAIVARKGHFFSVEFVNDQGDPLPVSALEKQLQQCIEQANTIPPTRPKLGLLTGCDRDTCADARQQMMSEGGIAMEEALAMLESGAILVTLDDESPISRREISELCWTGGLDSGENRWFDKSIQIVVANNGKAGVLGEHSMMDGMPVVNYADSITKMTYAEAKNLSGERSTGDIAVNDIFGEAIEKMDHSGINDLETKARASFHELINSQENQTQSFQGYGSTFIKNSGFSPDAYVQMAMQLATYRLFGEQGGTYEATQVRPFLHGRTETTRTVSPASEKFIEAMGLYAKMDEADVMIRKEKLRLLEEATRYHSQYTGNAAAAQGVDRHFLGLSMLIKDDETVPTLFSDPVFIRSKRWRVSTSHLTHPRFACWGFGEVVPDGVGIGYSILPTSCVFHVTALKENGWSEPLSELLEEALLEMQRLIDFEKMPDSKL